MIYILTTDPYPMVGDRVYLENFRLKNGGFAIVKEIKKGMKKKEYGTTGLILGQNNKN